MLRGPRLSPSGLRRRFIGSLNPLSRFLSQNFSTEHREKKMTSMRSLPRSSYLQLPLSFSILYTPPGSFILSKECGRSDLRSTLLRGRRFSRATWTRSGYRLTGRSTAHLWASALHREDFSAGFWRSTSDSRSYLLLAPFSLSFLHSFCFSLPSSPCRAGRKILRSRCVTM